MAMIDHRCGFAADGAGAIALGIVEEPQSLGRQALAALDARQPGAGIGVSITHQAAVNCSRWRTRV
jgi:hypothetical protein